MGKKIRKVANVATFGLSGAVEKLAVDPIKAALGLGAGALGLGGGESQGQTGSTVASPEATPTAVSEGTLEAREAQRKRQLAAAGLSATNLTGAGGLSGAANTANKTLLGS